MGKIKTKGNNEREPDYQIAEIDINMLPVVRMMGELSDKQLKAILYIMGIDVNKPFKRNVLADGGKVGYRSKVSGQVVYDVHWVWDGFERTDDNWLKNGQDNAYNYLAGEKVGEFLNVLEGVEVGD